MNKITKLTSLEAQQQQHAAEQQTQQQSSLEFATVEEMLRHDAAQTIPPPAIEVRLKNSLAGEPKPPRSWWERLFARQSPNP